MDREKQAIVVGFDAKRIVSNTTGLGNYGRTLVNDLASDPALQLRLYAPDGGREPLRQQVVSQPNVTFCYPSKSWLPFYRQYWRSHWVVASLVADHVDVYHGLSGELPIGISRSGIKSVVTIHDLIFLRHPEYYHWLDTKIYAWKFRRTLQEADRIIAISECTKRDIMEFGGVSADKIDVIYQSCNPVFAQPLSESALAKVRHQYGLSSRFILNVGTIERRKNLLLAIRALDHLPQNIHLVAVGRRTDYVKEFPQNPRVHLLSGVTDETLKALYQLAEAFVYPSRYEGFGIPIIEAIHSGLPVVACTGSCLEEAGGPDSLYVAPDDVEGMAHAVSLSLKGAEGREERIRRSREYVRRFEGADVASQVKDVYRVMSYEL